MPERLEDRALPGGSLLGLLFGVPLAEPFLGSVWADGNPLGSDDLPGVEGRRREHLAALEGLQRDRLLADELFGEVRRLVDIAGATGTTADAYVDVARARLLGVAATLAGSEAARLASHDFLADLWWTDELLTSLARGRALGAPRFLAELPVEGDDPEGMTMLGYGGYGNMPPVANDDSYYTKHDTNLSVSPPGVKSNDYDSDGDPMTAILVSGPSHALSFTFNYNGNGSFTYTPAYHYVGMDTFTYKVNDGLVDKQHGDRLDQRLQQRAGGGQRRAVHHPPRHSVARVSARAAGERHRPGRRPAPRGGVVGESRPRDVGPAGQRGVHLYAVRRLRGHGLLPIQGL